MSDISQSSGQGIPVTSQPQAQHIFTSEDPIHYFLLTNQFANDVTAFQACANLMTGYKLMDRIQPFYPGFYCLGAIPSLGKTTFVQQLADQVASFGRHILYFSLEQTHFELFSKSLARGFFRTHRADAKANNRPSTYPTPSSVDIRRGIANAYPADLSAQINAYAQSVQNRIIVVNSLFSITVENIITIIRQVIDQLHVKPIVIIDYLQIVAPTLINNRIPDTKTSIDHIVHNLKAVQSDLGLTVLAISSLNRQNYLTTLDYESFKESGGIEYTADVIWGLQLAIMSDDNFYFTIDNKGKRKETSLKEKRDMVNAAKAQTPRKVALICLKNRFGRANYEVPFDYYPASDYFRAAFNKNDPDTWD